MTKKDYIKLAAAIAEAREGVCGDHDSFRTGVDAVAYHVADLLQQDNVAFDRSRFLKACGSL